MMFLLEVVSVLLVAVAFALALAHALEYPGKLRLDEAAYRAVQKIYYPGFTVGGGAEVLALLALLALAFATPAATEAFWWIVAAAVAMAAFNAAYWTLTHPVNKFWLEGEKLSGAGSSFFGVGGAGEAGADDWRKMRDRWEYSHILRAALGAIALIALTVATAL